MNSMSVNLIYCIIMIKSLDDGHLESLMSDVLL